MLWCGPVKMKGYFINLVFQSFQSSSKQHAMPPFLTSQHWVMSQTNKKYFSSVHQFIVSCPSVRVEADEQALFINDKAMIFLEHFEYSIYYYLCNYALLQVWHYYGIGCCVTWSVRTWQVWFYAYELIYTHESDLWDCKGGSKSKSFIK